MSVSEEQLARFRDDPFADHLNMSLVEVRTGFARAEMDAAESSAASTASSRAARSSRSRTTPSRPPATPTALARWR